MKRLFLTFALTIFYYIGDAQTSPLCVNAAQICQTGNMSFPANVDQTAEPGPNYGCLNSQPNPSWFYFQIDTPGDLVINMIQVDSLNTGVDIDFICWGPFSSPTTPCIDSVSLQSSAVDCSYSTNFMEVLDIYGAQNGEFYLVMVTNFANIPATVEFSIDTTSTATLSCDQNCLTNAFSNSPVCEGSSLQLNSTSHLEGGIYSWIGPNGFNSNIQNPLIPMVNSLSEGYYYVTYTQDTTCNYTDSVYVDVQTCTSIQELASNEQIMVYPNPYKNELNLVLNEFDEGNVSIQITNLTGQVMYQKDIWNNHALLVLKDIEIVHGIYFLNIKTKNRSMVKKIIHQ